VSSILRLKIHFCRNKWSKYLEDQGILYMFWSAEVAIAILEGKELPDPIVDDKEVDDEDAVLECKQLLSRM